MSAKLLHQIFKKLYGKPSWNVHRGYSSFITFEFGKPKLKVLKKVFMPGKNSGFTYPRRLAHVHGEWHLWIYCCDWVIRQDGRKVGDSTSEKNAEGCSVLGGQYLTKVVVNPKNWQTDFYFDLGGHLQTKAYPKNWRKDFPRHLKAKLHINELNEHEPSEMWNLRCPDGRYFLLRSDGKFSHQSGKTPPDKRVWQPFTV
jgi:hypothetical protein